MKTTYQEYKSVSTPWYPCRLEDQTDHSVYISRLPAGWKTKLSLHFICLDSLPIGRQNCPYSLSIWSSCWMEDKIDLCLYLWYPCLLVDRTVPTLVCNITVKKTQGITDIFHIFVFFSTKWEGTVSRWLPAHCSTTILASLPLAKTALTRVQIWRMSVPP